MKAMPFPFEEFQGKGVLDFSSATDSLSLLLHQQQKWTRDKEYCYVGTEPTSVLDSRRSPSPPTSSSTMSSSLGSNSSGKGGGCGSGSANNTICAAPNVSENPPHEALENSTVKCGMRMEDWEGQDQSILRLIMGDVEDPSAGLSKLLQSSGCGSQNVDFNGGFGGLDQGLNMESNIDPSVPGNYPGFSFIAENIDGHNAKAGSVSVSESIFSASGNNPMLMSSSPGVFNSQQHHHHHQEFGVVDEKPQVINPQFVLNQNQVQFSENPFFFVPLNYPQMQEQQVFSQQQAKRPLYDTVGHNHQVPRLPLLDSGQELFGRRQQTQLPLFPHHLQQQQSLVLPSTKQQKVSSTGDDASHQLQQSIFDQLYKTAELIEAGNPVHAQGILARLNHQLSPIGKPFQRAAFYMKEALQLLLHPNNENFLAFSPISFIFKIGAYKSFSEISPVLQFSNFTCNQALIEAVERFDQIHIIDFDIGFGVQWSSLMQELALRNSGAPSLKVTAVVSPSTCDEVELNFTRDHLNQYAKDINMSFELHVLSIESLNSPSCPLRGQFFDNEAIAVNMPVSCFTNYPSLVPSVLHFVKQLRPKVVVTLDKNCDRIDVPLPTNVVHVLQCYSALLESLDAVNVNLDVLQKIERHFIQPAIKKIILGHQHSQEKLPSWRNLFFQSGFSPFTFSNFTEVQAECLAQRAPVRGFQVERKPSSLVLCWQRKELISVSTWRC
ncbi:scarecrow-like protein 6 [Gastrolobium bilobum]|uniref:scarecrow-like protein 6 n=1 Tax=Gastrolobium bilobum TaxID=150636 RepID=UPI002AB27768|nr:scarecrow-like protein 6 [Gastrolobium bilobum]XP_061363829.1 scarecrow-like protein 6 [Gastrolobium bilobum]